ncbi:MAG: tRNA 2-thiouridine(34) synthase MnmA [Flavobacteriales bacterium]|nr:tRNA 2-thiouridine(34) synthase MnmA [Flavobacteriales bacterium]MCX7767593.1 tRNA 2-thiouridine(34) synthase MnmA [Flavobacteriales bacterium]MDW8410235.1 tRNA 2-thiouridine(34) synthase MnmA [Flavobacteriales bacterium]
MDLADNRVLVAMSGGVDSSVTALLLHRQGYEVIGITMKTWDYATSGGNRKTTGCCSLDDIHDARALAVDLGFPHYILDIREEFGEYIIDNFTNEYLAGRTPNPCVLCNTYIKWNALLRRADLLGCRWIATGHYASVHLINDRYVVSRGRDQAKDQSYVLWGLSQAALSRTILPLGAYTKAEIRAIARQAGYEFLARKAESYEICFVPDNDYRAFLRRRIPDLDKKIGPGPFRDSSGKIVGTHQGYPFYTVGQRKGLGLALGYPVYVTRIEPETNTIYIGTEEELRQTTIFVRDYNLIKYKEINEPLRVWAKIRYKDPGAPATLRKEGNMLELTFERPVSAVAPGQSAVFYEGDHLVGGGIIV